MRWLINYIRSCFCKHEFAKEEQKHQIEDQGRLVGSWTSVVLECKKCGYHKEYKKHSEGYVY